MFVIVSLLRWFVEFLCGFDVCLLTLALCWLIFDLWCGAGLSVWWVFVLLAFWLFVFVISCCVCDFARWFVGLRCCLVLG